MWFKCTHHPKVRCTLRCNFTSPYFCAATILNSKYVRKLLMPVQSAGIIHQQHSSCRLLTPKQTYSRTRIHAHTRTYTHIHAHTRTYTHIHARTHTVIYDAPVMQSMLSPMESNEFFETYYMKEPVHIHRVRNKIAMIMLSLLSLSVVSINFLKLI